MKLKIFSRIFLSASLFSVLLFSVAAPVLALDLSKPLAGDSRCGGLNNPCSVLGIFAELKDVFVYAIIIIAFFALISFIWIGVKGLTASDQPAVMAEARKQGGQALVTLIIAIFFGAIVVAVASALIKSEYTTYLKQLFSRLDDSSFGVQTAHAANAVTTSCNGHLCNPLVFNSVYDVGVVIYQLVMRWILVPVLIGSWIWAGFLFIVAQGNPEKIKHAKSRLMYSAIWTVALMLVLGLAYAFRDTFNQVIS